METVTGNSVNPNPSGFLRGLALGGSVLAIVAHPDDESFGLGAVLTALSGAGAQVRVLCFTRGEASTLGATDDLGRRREQELARAIIELGIAGVALEGFADGTLAEVPQSVLDAVVEEHLGDATLLVVFEPAGVTGHSDHRAATAAALRIAKRHRLAVLEWGVAGTVAASLNAELGAAFVAFDGADAYDVVVDRTRQLASIACHDSQALDNPVLARRLQLQGDHERVRLQMPTDW